MDDGSAGGRPGPRTGRSCSASDYSDGRSHDRLCRSSARACEAHLRPARLRVGLRSNPLDRRARPHDELVGHRPGGGALWRVTLPPPNAGTSSTTDTASPVRTAALASLTPRLTTSSTTRCGGWRMSETPTTSAACNCDGAAYFTPEQNRVRHPFIVNATCSVHGYSPTDLLRAADAYRWERETPSGRIARLLRWGKR